MMASAPAQSLELAGGDIGFVLTGDNFLSTIGAQDFSVGINTPASTLYATGSFAGLGLAAGDSQPYTFVGPLESLDFTYTGSGTGTFSNPWLYTLTEDETFTFDVDGSDDLFLTFRAGTQFEGIKDGVSAEIDLCDTCFSSAFWAYQGDITAASSTFQLGVSGANSPLSVGIVTSSVAAIPEPLTILGTGLALGFGGLFKSKSSKKQSVEA
jgi:hypothetical protein